MVSGFGVLPWVDVTAEGEEDATLPESDDMKEALLRFMRLSTCSVTATTAAAMEARLRAITTGNATKPKNPPHVFPEFRPAMVPTGGEQRRHEGWCFSLSPI